MNINSSGFWLLGTVVFLGNIQGQALAETPSEQLATIQRAATHRSLRLAKDPPKISDEVYLKALGGKPVAGVEIVEGIRAGKGWGVQVVPLPIEDLWSTLTDEQQVSGEMGLLVSDVVGGQPYQDGRRIFQVLDLPYPIDNRYWVTRVSHADEMYTASNGLLWELSWVDVTADFDLGATKYASYLEDATPLKWTRGSWLLIPLTKTETLIEYHVWSEPGGRIPAALAIKFVPNQVLKTIQSMSNLTGRRQATGRSQNQVRPDGSPL